jgi:hypothetical protein
MSDRVPQRVLQALAADPWAITDQALAEICSIAERLGDGPEALAARLGRPLDNTRAVTVRDGVAVLPIVGPLFTRAGLFDDVSGATSFDQVARDLRTPVT